MKFEYNDVTVKVKKSNLVISSGVVLEDEICRMPIELIPKIKWNKDIKKLIVDALIEKDEFKIVMLMKGKIKEEE